MLRWLIETTNRDLFVTVQDLPLHFSIGAGPSGSILWRSVCCGEGHYVVSDPAFRSVGVGYQYSLAQCSRCHVTYSMPGRYEGAGAFNDLGMLEQARTHMYVVRVKKDREEFRGILLNALTHLDQVALLDEVEADLLILLAAMKAGETHRRALRVKGEGKMSDPREATRWAEGMGLYFTDRGLLARFQTA